MLRAIALIAGLIIAGTVHAQEFADFDWKLSKIFIAAPEFAGVVPSTAKRRPEGVGGGPGSSVTLAVDVLAFRSSNGHEALVQHVYALRSMTFSPTKIEAYVKSIEFFSRNNVFVGNEERYSRRGASGSTALFSYKKGQETVDCVAYDFVYRNDRSYGVFCNPPNQKLSSAAAISFVDSVGIKGILEPAIFPVSSTAPAVSAPATTAQPAAGTVAERLSKLKDLFDQKLITQTEYEQKRKAIIDGL